MSFIEQPNLPESIVTDVLVSSEISTASEFALNKYGITVHKTKECQSLYNAVKFHPDMTFCHLKSNYAAAEHSQAEYYRSEFPFLNVCSGNRIDNKYPRDIAYNATRIGRYLICKKSHTDATILSFAEKEGLEVIDVKQGYSKCNICIVDENAIITSDFGIKKALGKFPIDVLHVFDESILLKDCNHGFLGGATGKIASDKLAVNGNIMLHKNAKEIIEFAKKYDVEIISLNNDTIEDIGSIIPILEK